MTKVVRARRIEATADQVWAVLADFGAIASWAPNVDHASLMSDRAVDVGCLRRVQVGRVTLVERVFEWTPPSTLAYEIEGLPPVVRSAVNRWTIEPVGEAAMVSLSSTIDAGPRPPQQLVARAIGRRLGAANDQLLSGLDTYITIDQAVTT